jgi:hypothetical protein
VIDSVTSETIFKIENVNDYDTDKLLSLRYMKICKFCGTASGPKKRKCKECGNPLPK